MSRLSSVLLAALASTTLSTSVHAGPKKNSAGAAAPLAKKASVDTRSHRQVVQSVAQMVSDRKAQQLASKHGLQFINVLWEDTGRYLGSSVGPNISDVTIEVETENAQSKKVRSLMPVIRYPNFTDKTGDVDIDSLFVRVGNHKEGGGKAKSVSLRELLDDPLKYMSHPKAGKIKGNSLLAERDEHVLVSAQSTFLPIRKGGSTRFWPVIFNYQSSKDNPAVLTILVTRQGTSMTIIDNERDTVGDGSSWGQRLYFNHEGARAPLTAERLSDVKAKGSTQDGEDSASVGADANLLMLIQVPLKHKQTARPSFAMAESAMLGGALDDGLMDRRSGASNVEAAVLGHGPTEGPFTELDALTIERDPRFPVRVTVQFYQATSNGVVSGEDIERMAKKIDKVYKKADFVGSLVVPEGERRPTMWDGAHSMPDITSWRDFAGLRQRFQKYGVAGVLYRDDMVADASEPPPFHAVLIGEALQMVIGTVIVR